MIRGESCGGRQLIPLRMAAQKEAIEKPITPPGSSVMNFALFISRSDY